MWARMVTCQIKPGMMDEFVAIYRDSIMPAAKQQKGFRAATLLTEPLTGKAVSMAMFDTLDELLVSETSGYLQEQIANAAPTFAAPLILERFTVSVEVGHTNAA